MVKVGRYHIGVGEYFWMQAKKPVVGRRFLFFNIFKEVDPLATDKKQQFPLGTEAKCGGEKYYYSKAGADINTKEVPH